MLVVFVGGVTFAEISALRFLSAQVCQVLSLESAVLQASLFLVVSTIYIMLKYLHSVNKLRLFLVPGKC